MEECEMTELEKLKAAKEVWETWCDTPRAPNLKDWLDAEIARLKDPHVEAKAILANYERNGYYGEGGKLLAYARHLESELAKAKEAAAEPLNDKIDCLEDPFAQAKHKLHGWSKSETTTAGTWNLIQYVEHLKNERDHYKIEYKHAKEAAAEPLDPKRVLATAAAVINSNKVDKGEFLYLDMTRAFRVCSGLSKKTKPYEVQE
jgi:hypothetical protein